MAHSRIPARASPHLGGSTSPAAPPLGMPALRPGASPHHGGSVNAVSMLRTRTPATLSATTIAIVFMIPVPIRPTPSGHRAALTISTPFIALPSLSRTAFTGLA